MKTLEDQRRALEDKLNEWKRLPSASSPPPIPIFNNNNNRIRTSSISLASVNSASFDDRDLLVGSRLILSGVIQLATHVLVDYAKSPAVVRRHFGSFARHQISRFAAPYGRLKGIVSDSALTNIVAAYRHDSLEPLVSLPALPATVSSPIEAVESFCCDVDSSAVENVDFSGQTEFWYESEWDEDLYEVDWDHDSTSV